MLGTTASSDSLTAALFGKAQHSVLGLLFVHPDESFYVREIVRATQVGQGAVQRELQRLAEAGIIDRTVRGRQVFYQANRACPVFAELQGLVIKTAGVGDVLRAALGPLENRIEVAFVFGSFAAGTPRKNSDVDVLVVGDVSFADVVTSLGSAQERLGRDVNPSVFPVAEFRTKLATGHHFVSTVVREPKIFLIGDERELARLVASRLANRTQTNPARNKKLVRRRRS
jgi:predicted nucleotidyltransferase